MTTYTSESIAEGLEFFCEGAQMAFLTEPDDTNAKRFLKGYITGQEDAALLHLTGKLLATGMPIRLGTGVFNHTARETLEMLLNAYLWPYFCEDDLVEQKIRASSHCGQLPAPKRRAQAAA